jgi:phosphatidate phosphatase APP1
VDRSRRSAVALELTLAVEDVVQAGLVRLAARLRRRQVTVLPFIGYGTPQTVRVRGRVLLRRSPGHAAATELVRGDEAQIDRVRTGARSEAPASAPGPGPGVGSARGGRATAGSARDGQAGAWSVEGGGPAAGAAAGARVPVGSVGGTRRGVTARRWSEEYRERWRIFRDAVAPFVSLELPRNPVTVSGPGGPVAACADRQGYLDVPVEVGGLAPGWYELAVATSWRGQSAEAAVPVLVVDPESTLAVISDLDDTVIETGITRGLEFLRLTLLTEVTERTPLPGAAELYRALTAPRGGRAVPVFYVSVSPWNLYELLTRFLVLRGFPAGPLLLTDWGPSRTNLFRVPTEEHKLTLIRALLADHPALRVVLIGDTGELDPEIYATIAQESPDRVRAVYVRRTVGMRDARAVEVHGLARRVAAYGVPMLVVEDSVQIAEHAAGLGLLDAADVQAVRGAT